MRLFFFFFFSAILNFGRVEGVRWSHTQVGCPLQGFVRRGGRSVNRQGLPSIRIPRAVSPPPPVQSKVDPYLYSVGTLVARTTKFSPLRALHFLSSTRLVTHFPFHAPPCTAFVNLVALLCTARRTTASLSVHFTLALESILHHIWHNFYIVACLSARDRLATVFTIGSYSFSLSFLCPASFFFSDAPRQKAVWPYIAIAIAIARRSCPRLGTARTTLPDTPSTSPAAKASLRNRKFTYFPRTCPDSLLFSHFTVRGHSRSSRRVLLTTSSSKTPLYLCWTHPSRYAVVPRL